MAGADQRCGAAAVVQWGRRRASCIVPGEAHAYRVEEERGQGVGRQTTPGPRHSERRWRVRGLLTVGPARSDCKRTSRVGLQLPCRHASRPRERSAERPSSPGCIEIRVCVSLLPSYSSTAIVGLWFGAHSPHRTGIFHSRSESRHAHAPAATGGSAVGVGPESRTR